MKYWKPRKLHGAAIKDLFSFGKTTKYLNYNNRSFALKPFVEREEIDNDMQLMESLHMKKYRNNDKHRKLLMRTGGKYILFDVWNAMKHQEAKGGEKHKLGGEINGKLLYGMNEYGKMLMRIREKLRSEEAGVRQDEEGGSDDELVRNLEKDLPEEDDEMQGAGSSNGGKKRVRDVSEDDTMESPDEDEPPEAEDKRNADRKKEAKRSKKNAKEEGGSYKDSRSTKKKTWDKNGKQKKKSSKKVVEEEDVEE